MAESCRDFPILHIQIPAKILYCPMPKCLLILLFCFETIAAQQYNYYFGNLHAHTSFSDGNRDSVQASIYGPGASYAYAKNSQDFDFLGISEHNHYSTARNPGFKRPRYAEGLKLADSLNEEGKFLCLYGMEYGVSSTNNGHVIIYGFDQHIGWESNVGGMIGPNYDLYNGRSDYAALFTKIARRSNAFAYLAHPYWTDFTTDGTDSSAIVYAPHNASFDSAIVAVPLRSGNAFSTFNNYGDYSPLNYFNYFKKMLNQGYHIGIGYDHDNHYSNFGRSNGGRLVALMPSLTRQNLYTAMQQMHFYGSDDANAQLDFKLNNAIMGSVLENENAYPLITVLHSDPDGEQADTIRIWKGFKGSSAWAYTVQTVVGQNATSYYDQSIAPEKEYYYFIELRQKDGHWMVSSPIWYKSSNVVGIKNEVGRESIQIVFDSFSKQLLLLNPLEKNANIEVLNLSAVVLLQEKFQNEKMSWNLSEFPQGIYLVKLQTEQGTRLKKIQIY